LEKAIEVVRQAEMIRQQMNEQSLVHEKHAEVSAINAGARSKFKHNMYPPKKRDFKKKQAGESCTRCGKSSHPLDRCPARDKKCHKCGKIGHFAKYCWSKHLRKKTVAEVQNQQYVGKSDNLFLGSIVHEIHESGN
jgi:hypothetical protein